MKRSLFGFTREALWQLYGKLGLICRNKHKTNTHLSCRPHIYTKTTSSENTCSRYPSSPPQKRTRSLF